MERAIDFAMKKSGVVELKKRTERVSAAVSRSHDVFGSLPTSYGKSFIYKNISSRSLVSTTLSPKNLSLFAFSVPCKISPL